MEDIAVAAEGLELHSRPRQIGHNVATVATFGNLLPTR